MKLLPKVKLMLCLVSHLKIGGDFFIMKTKFIDLTGLTFVKNILINLISTHTNNSNIHITEQERYKINNFPSKISSFENDVEYITMQDFLLNSEYDGGDSLGVNILDKKDIDGGNSLKSAEI